MIVLFTDFGLDGPYVGQMKAVLHRDAPGVPVVDLMHDAPAHAPRPAAYLLAAYAQAFPDDAVIIGVVDPGVGTAERRPVALRAGGRWFVGPDNGLFDIAARRVGGIEWHTLAAPAAPPSASFHGRDVFAPAAASLARGAIPGGAAPVRPSGAGRGWPDDLAEIVYVDRFGNAMTGLRAATLGAGARLEVDGATVARARTFGDVPEGAAMWYENANGLAEIAVNRGRADAVLGLRVGAAVAVRDAPEAPA